VKYYGLVHAIIAKAIKTPVKSEENFETVGFRALLLP
jgi:hypothetical protein